MRIGPSKLAEWHGLITDAQAEAGYELEDSLAYYLVLTLDQFTDKNEIASSVIAVDYLACLDIQNELGVSQLRQVGDQCLLLSGLFPERAQRKNVSVDYFIGMGQQAYNSIASSHPRLKIDPELFFKLSEQFKDLTEVLQTLRSFPEKRLLIRLQ